VAERLPAINGPQLIRLLERDGWQAGRHTTHGQALRKRIGDRTRVTTIPTKQMSLPSGTLAKILGPLQTGIGREGLRELIERYGLR
jgi:predicted RNA binding protein YcfA (HicA-like mRNA interferase family)